MDVTLCVFYLDCAKCWSAQGLRRIITERRFNKVNLSVISTLIHHGNRRGKNQLPELGSSYKTIKNTVTYFIKNAKVRAAAVKEGRKLLPESVCKFWLLYYSIYSTFICIQICSIHIKRCCTEKKNFL